ncbi:MAG: ribosome silencing factor [Bacillota bacterium]|nr:ribosome silencing factor [Bacillota bacterium]
MEPEALSELAAGAARDKKAEGVMLLDLRELTIMCDYFLICTARNTQHVKAVVEGVQERLEDAGRRARHIEGKSNARWVLMDYGDVIVHVFLPEERAFYDLERLWADARLTELAAVVEQARGVQHVDARTDASL